MGYRRTLAFSAIAAVAMLLVIYVSRDLPRRWLETYASRLLNAEVHITRLEVHRLGDIRLHGMRVRSLVEWPQIEAIEIGVATVHFEPRRLFEGDVQSLILDRLRVDLTSPCDSPTFPRRQPFEGHIGELVVRGGVVHLSSSEPASEVEFEARLTDVSAQSARGEITLAAGLLGQSDLTRLLSASAVCVDDTAAGQLDALTLRDARSRVLFDLAAGVAEAEVEAVALTAEMFDVEIELAAPRLRLRTKSGGETAFDDYFGGTGDLTIDRLRVSRGGREVIGSATRLELELETEAEGGPTLQARSALSPLGTVEVSASWPPSSSLPEFLSVDIGELDVGLWGALLPVDLGLSDLQGRAELHLEGPIDELDYALEVHLDDAAWQRADVRVDIAAVHLLHNGRFSNTSLSGPLEVELVVEELSGSGEVVIPAALLPLSATLAGEAALGAESTITGLVTLASSRLGSGSVAGRVSFAGEEVQGDLRWDWRIVDTGPLLTELPFSIPGWLDGSIAASGHLQGPLFDPRLTAVIELSDGGWTDDALTPWRWRGAPHFVVVRDPGSSQVSLRLEESTGVVRLVPGGRELAYELAGRGRLGLDSRTFEVDEVEVHLAELMDARISGRWEDGEVTGEARIQARDPERWSTELGFGVLLPDYETTGSLEAALTGERSAAGEIAAEGAVSVSGGLASDDGSKVLAGLSGEYRVTATFDGGDLEARAFGELGGFEALVGELYADYQERSVSMDLKLGSRVVGGDRLWTAAGEAWVPEGAVRAEGSVTRSVDGGIDYSLAASVEDLGAALGYLVQTPFQGSVPQIADLRANGSLELTAAGRFDDESDHEIEGRLRVTEGAVEAPGGSYGADRLDLDLPFHLRWKEGDLVASPAEEALFGRLGFGRIRFAGLEISPTAANLRVLDDSVDFDRHVSFPFLSGNVTLESLSLEGLLRPQRGLASAVRLRGLQLGDLSKAMGWLPLEGQVEGYFPSVHLTPESLVVLGESRVALFDGTVVVENISGSDLLSRFPKLGFSARFFDIDLGALTRTIEFGAITGKLQGYVRDVELFRDVPVRFSARFETVPRRGERQTVSVKAISNLALVSGGRRVSLFDRGLYSFFRRYRYRSLGVQVLLNQDRFLLRGLEQRAGKELILRGRSPRRLDIVNVRPGRTVYFQTMLERLGNLDVRTGGEDERP